MSPRHGHCDVGRTWPLDMDMVDIMDVDMVVEVDMVMLAGIFP